MRLCSNGEGHCESSSMSSCLGQWDTSGVWTHLTGAVGVQSQQGCEGGAEFEASLKKQMLEEGSLGSLLRRFGSSIKLVEVLGKKKSSPSA